MEILDQLRQGDVSIEKIDKIPDGAKKRKDKSNNILVYGELTDHAHMVEGNGVAIMERVGNETDDVVAYINIPEKADIVHRNTRTGIQTDDHGTINLDAGNYQVIRQREYDPYEKAIRRVRD